MLIWEVCGGGYGIFKILRVYLFFILVVVELIKVRGYWKYIFLLLVFFCSGYYRWV